MTEGKPEGIFNVFNQQVRREWKAAREIDPRQSENGIKQKIKNLYRDYQNRLKRASEDPLIVPDVAASNQRFRNEALKMIQETSAKNTPTTTEDFRDTAAESASAAKYERVEEMMAEKKVENQQPITTSTQTVESDKATPSAPESVNSPQTVQEVAFDKEKSEMDEIKKVRPRFFVDLMGQERTLEQFAKMNQQRKIAGRAGTSPQDRRLYSDRYFDDMNNPNIPKVLDALASQQKWNVRYVDYLGAGGFSDVILIFYSSQENDKLQHQVIKIERNKNKEVHANDELNQAQIAFGTEHVSETKVIELPEAVVQAQELMKPVVFAEGNKSEEQRKNLLLFHKSILRAICLGYLPDLNELTGSYLASPTFGVSENGIVKILDMNALSLFSISAMKELASEPYFQNGQLPIEFDEQGKPISLLPAFKEKLKTLQFSPTGGLSGYDHRISAFDFSSPSMLENLVLGKEAAFFSPEKNAGLLTIANSIDQIRQFGSGEDLSRAQLVIMGHKNQNVVKTPNEIARAQVAADLKTEIENTFVNFQDMELLADFVSEQASHIQEIIDPEEKKNAVYGIVMKLFYISETFNGGQALLPESLQQLMNQFADAAIEMSYQRMEKISLDQLMNACKLLQEVIHERVVYFRQNAKTPDDVLNNFGLKRFFEVNGSSNDIQNFKAYRAKTQA